MKWTRANVEYYATQKGWEPVQIDGIPEGFSWKQPDITINGKDYEGRVFTFEPLTDNEPKEHGN